MIDHLMQMITRWLHPIKTARYERADLQRMYHEERQRVQRKQDEIDGRLQSLEIEAEIRGRRQRSDDN